MGVMVAKLHQQTPNPDGAATGAPDQAQGFRDCLPSLSNLLKQETFELSAIRGPIRIIRHRQPASSALQGCEKLKPAAADPTDCDCG